MQRDGGGGGKGLQDSDCLLFINVFLVDWLPRPLGKLQSFPLFVFQFPVSVSLFTFHFFLTNWSPWKRGGGGEGVNKIYYTHVCKWVQFLGDSDGIIESVCAEKSERRPTKKIANSVNYIKWTSQKLKIYARRQDKAGAERGGRGEKERGQTDRQSHVRVVAESIRTDVPVRELFSFFAFLWHMWASGTGLIYSNKSGKLVR